MTDQDLNRLKSHIDRVLIVETREEGRHLGRILFVFDEGETPDVFYLRVERGADGACVEQAGGGRSVLLADIVGVYPLETAAQDHPSEPL